MAEIRFEDVYKSFGAKAAVQGITLTCPDERYVCLLGPSGCGKTTMLRLLAGLESPERGDLLVGGERINDLDPAARNVGLAFQNYALYPNLRVRDNLAFPLRAPRRRGQFAASEIERRVDEIASLLKIGELLDRRPGQLSGGQQQRVSLGRALVRHPPALLLDEPITHLDARLRYEMRAELKTLHQRMRTTTIHVTHDQQEALALADLIVVMREGRIEQVGAPLEVFTRPATDFVAGFLGDPPYSLIDAEVERSEGGLHARLAGTALPLPDSVGWTCPPGPGFDWACDRSTSRSLHPTTAAPFPEASIRTRRSDASCSSSSRSTEAGCEFEHAIACRFVPETGCG